MNTSYMKYWWVLAIALIVIAISSRETLLLFEVGLWCIWAIVVFLAVSVLSQAWYKRRDPHSEFFLVVAVLQTGAARIFLDGGFVVFLLSLFAGFSSPDPSKLIFAKQNAVVPVAAGFFILNWLWRRYRTQRESAWGS